MTIRQLTKKLFRLSDWLALKRIEPYTMVGHNRLYDLIGLLKLMERNNLTGAVVECGVWKGGAAAIMAREIKRHGYHRHLWLFDSFAGLPAPSLIDGPAAVEQFEIDRGESSVTDVESALAKFKIDLNQVSIIPGWFDQTLLSKREAIGPIALLRLDSDWYQSTKTCLETLYEQVVPNGYVVIDDYGSWPGAKQAVDEFLASRPAERINLRPLSDGSVFWVKSVTLPKPEYWSGETQKYQEPHLRLKRLAGEINRLPLKTGTVLDLGCGPGTLGHLLDRSRFQYFGVDVFKQELATGAYGQFDLDHDDWDQFSFQQKFDVVVLSGVLEYLAPERIEELLRFIRQNLVKPETVLVVTYTNFEHYLRRPINYHPAWTVTRPIKKMLSVLANTGFRLIKKYPSYYFVLNRRLFSPRVWLPWLSRRFGRQIIFILKLSD